MKNLKTLLITFSLSFFYHATYAQISIMNGGSNQGLLIQVPDKYAFGHNPKFNYIKPENTYGFWRLRIFPERISTMLQELQVKYEYDIDIPKVVHGVNALGHETIYTIADYGVNITGRIEFKISGQYINPLNKEISEFSFTTYVDVLGKSTKAKVSLFTWGPDIVDAIRELGINEESNPTNAFLSNFKVVITSIEAVSKNYNGYEELDRRIGEKINNDKIEIDFNKLIQEAQFAESQGNTELALKKYEEAYKIKKDSSLKQKIDQVKQEENEITNTNSNSGNTSNQGFQSSYNQNDNSTSYGNNNPSNSNSNTEQSQQVSNNTQSNPGGWRKFDEMQDNFNKNENFLNSNRYDYFSAEELKKTQRNLDFWIGTFHSTVANDLVISGYEKQLRNLLSRPLELDPTNLIRQQALRKKEAVKILQLKQEAVRKASDEAALRAINSSNNVQELQVLTVTAVGVKAINEISFKAEKKKMLEKLEKANKKEIDELYQIIAPPIEKAAISYRNAAIAQWDFQKENLAAQWANYYDELLNRINAQFSYNSTHWADLDKIAFGIEKPDQQLTLNNSTPSKLQAFEASKRKLEAWSSPYPFKTLAKMKENAPQYQNLRNWISSSVLFHQNHFNFMQNDSIKRIISNNRVSPNNKELDSTNAVLALHKNRQDSLMKVKEKASKILNFKSGENISWVDDLRKAAMAYLSIVIEEDKNNAEAYYLLGLANYNLNKRLELLSTAYALEPDNLVYKEDAFWAQTLMNDNEELFNRYLRDFPNGIYRNEADSYLEYRKEATRLSSFNTEAQREANGQAFLNIKNSVWLKYKHIPNLILFEKENEAKQLFNNLTHDFVMKSKLGEIEDYIEKYSGTSHAEKAKKLLPKARAFNKFTFFEIEFSTLYLLSGSFESDYSSYSEPTNYPFGLNFSQTINQTENLTSNRSTGLSARAAISPVLTPLNKNGTLALGWGFAINYTRLPKLNGVNFRNTSQATNFVEIDSIWQSSGSHSFNYSTGVLNIVDFELFTIGISKYLNIYPSFSIFGNSSHLMYNVKSECNLYKNLGIAFHIQRYATHLQKGHGKYGDNLNSIDLKLTYYLKNLPFAFYAGFQAFNFSTNYPLFQNVGGPSITSYDYLEKYTYRTINVGIRYTNFKWVK